MGESLEPTIERLNADCTCVTLDLDALCRAAAEVVGDTAFCRDLASTHPHLLSAQPLFLSAQHAERMQRIIEAIETVVRLPAYQAAALGHAPAIASYDPGPAGIFMGYDFHLGPTGPRLIEINTNAGGALINAYLLQAQRACCTEMSAAAGRFDIKALLDKFISSIESEWGSQGRSRPLQSIAIIDQSPNTQYLYPEFVLFQRLFQARGLTALIGAPEELAHRDGALWLGPQRIDFVYNRLTDFELGLPETSALRGAYMAGDVVVTPNPRAHALFANKKNLVLLSDGATLRRWGVSEDVVATLRDGIPATVLVNGADADDLWARRNKLFFKPASGYGGKATYRGDKITRKVWTEILAGDFVAQELVPPSARAIAIDGQLHPMKADLRNYTYRGEVQLIAARLYQGQTTNFRTLGGGFAPVFVSDKAHVHPCH